mmetsp:Transcript_21212/g.49773  ORF Transcript_21212/g.49773 Transcript_21212/m.49773 type:complete len:483 (-) Transcript_21212:63-1511(-)
MLPQVHHKFLEHLRKSSDGKPQVSVPTKEVLPPELLTWRRSLDSFLPVLGALSRSMLVRNTCAIGLGSLLLAAGGLTAARWPAIFGLVLVTAGCRGLPGGTPFLEVETEAGFYADLKGRMAARNQKICQSMQNWMNSFVPCPWQQSGELCTIAPYMINRKRFGELKYERIWLSADDGESFASDFVFPPGGFDPSRPVVVLLTGLAPSKHWTEAAGFIADAAGHLSRCSNMTVVIKVARGTMDTQVNANLFHGARVTDLRKLLELLDKCLKAVSEPGIPKAAVFASGYSMGAIILANYCGHYGPDALLEGAISFSGLNDAVKNMSFEYSADTWQAALAYSLKQTIVQGHIEEAKRRGVDIGKVLSSKVASVVDVDKDFVSIYNGYDGVLDYYRDLSVAFDDKWRKVSIPLLSVAARDDPITHCDSLRAKEFFAENENLLFLITEKGGHVGWPWGLRPWKKGWDFMNEAIQVFAEAVLSCRPQD